MFCNNLKVNPALLTFLSRRNASSQSRFKFKQSEGPKKVQLSEYMMLMVPATTFCLGVWQVQRRSWKIDLLKQLEEKTSAPAINLPLDVEDLSTLEYQRVYIRGEFQHGKEVYIGPRSRVTSADSGGGLFGTSDNIGFHVVVPFKLEDSDASILVNRGWVPKNKLTAQSRQEQVPYGVTDLIGVVRVSEPKQQFTPKNMEESNRWSSRDVEALSRKLDTLPIFVDADAQSTVPNGPVGGQTRVTMRNDHLSYLITWFSLSAATLFMWIRKYAPK